MWLTMSAFKHEASEHPFSADACKNNKHTKSTCIQQQNLLLLNEVHHDLLSTTAVRCDRQHIT